MGCLRLLLALSVVAGHTQTFFRGFWFINAKAAVACFFVVSGFYMALVLNEKYTSRAAFLANRWVRIYVPYIVVVAFYGTYLFEAGHLQISRELMTLNLGLLGQDVYRMLNILPTPHNILGTDVIIVPQAWTLSVELELYVIAALLFPFGKRGVLAALGLGVALRIWLYFVGYVAPPYGIMFVGNALLFFAMGGGAYLGYTMVRHHSRARNASMSTVVLVALACYVLYYNGLQYPMEAEGSDWRFLPLYGLTALLLPFLFASTHDIKLDHMIGELSYPTYLVHVVVIDISNHIDFSLVGGPNVAHYAKCWFTLGTTLAAALGLYLAVDQPLTTVRRRWSSRPKLRPVPVG